MVFLYSVNQKYNKYLHSVKIQKAYRGTVFLKDISLRGIKTRRRPAPYRTGQAGARLCGTMAVRSLGLRRVVSLAETHVSFQKTDTTLRTGLEEPDKGQRKMQMNRVQVHCRQCPVTLGRFASPLVPAFKLILKGYTSP